MKHILFLLTILSITFSQNFGFGGRYQNNEFVTLSFLSSKIEIDLGLGFSQSSVNDVDTSFSIFNFTYNMFTYIKHSCNFYTFYFIG